MTSAWIPLFVWFEKYVDVLPTPRFLTQLEGKFHVLRWLWRGEKRSPFSWSRQSKAKQKDICHIHWRWCDLWRKQSRRDGWTCLFTSNFWHSSFKRQKTFYFAFQARFSLLDSWTSLFNNYSPKWRWLVVDIYRAAKRRGKYPTLATDTEVNSCFSIY